LKCCEDMHRVGPAKSANIALGQFGPDNPLHFGSWKRSISSCAIPTSDKTCSCGIG
jgi:hypothetical protein